jgi:hypothetical protein
MPPTACHDRGTAGSELVEELVKAAASFPAGLLQDKHAAAVAGQRIHARIGAAQDSW